MSVGINSNATRSKIDPKNSNTFYGYVSDMSVMCVITDTDRIVPSIPSKIFLSTNDNASENMSTSSDAYAIELKSGVRTLS